MNSHNFLPKNAPIGIWSHDFCQKMLTVGFEPTTFSRKCSRCDLVKIYFLDKILSFGIVWKYCLDTLCIEMKTEIYRSGTWTIPTINHWLCLNQGLIPTLWKKPSWKPVHEGFVEEVLVVKVCQAFSCKNYNMNSEQVN